MSVEDSKGAGQAIKKPRARSKLPIKLFGSPNPRQKRHITNNFISSTPLSALKKNLIEQLGLSPIRNPSSTTTESSPAKLSKIDDEVLPQNKVTITDDKKTLTSTCSKSFYPFPLSRLPIRNMVLCDDSPRQPKKSTGKDKFEKISGITNINSAESTERNEVYNVKSNEKEIQINDEANCSDIFLIENDKQMSNNKNKLEKDLINNKRKHSPPNKNTKENKIDDNIFISEIKNNEIVIHETKSHKSKRGKQKKLISVNKSIKKQVLLPPTKISNKSEQFSQTTEIQNNSRHKGRSAKVITNEISDGILSRKDSNKTVQFSQNETQNSNFKLRGSTTNSKNVTDDRSKRPINNIPIKTVNKKLNNKTNNKKNSTKSIESENSLRKSPRKRIPCVQYWLTNTVKDVTINQNQKEISKLENKSTNSEKEIFKLPLKKNSRTKSSKLIDKLQEKPQEKSSTNKLYEKDEHIVVTRKSKYGGNSKTLEKTISQELDVINKNMNEMPVPNRNLRSSKTEISSINKILKSPEKSQSSIEEQIESIQQSKTSEQNNVIDELITEKIISQENDAIRKKMNEIPLRNKNLRSSKTKISSTNKILKTPEKSQSCIEEQIESIQQPKTTEQNNIIDELITEKNISQENDAIRKKMNEIPLRNKNLRSSKTKISSTNKILKTPEKSQSCIEEQIESIQQPKTPEQNNVIDQLITLSIKKSSVKRTANNSRVLTAGKIRRSLVLKNRPSIKKTTPTDDDYTTEEEDGIPSDTLLVNKEEPRQNEIFHETRKRKKSSVDTFDIKKAKISNTEYSFKNLALEADIAPFRAGGLADVKINGKRCLLGCFGKFPRQLNTNAGNPDISVGISLNNPYIATGIIEINPDGQKKYEFSKKADLLLVVLEGKAEVGIGNSSQVFRMGQDFFVPRDTPYYIINLSATDKLLLYFSKYLNK